MADVGVEPEGRTAHGGHMLSDEEIERRSLAVLADRRARGEIMTDHLDGWAVREFPGMRIVRLCKEEDFRQRTIRTPHASADRLRGPERVRGKHDPRHRRRSR